MLSGSKILWWAPLTDADSHTPVVNREREWVLHWVFVLGYTQPQFFSLPRVLSGPNTCSTCRGSLPAYDRHAVALPLEWEHAVSVIVTHGKKLIVYWPSKHMCTHTQYATCAYFTGPSTVCDPCVRILLGQMLSSLNSCLPGIWDCNLIWK